MGTLTTFNCGAFTDDLHVVSRLSGPICFAAYSFTAGFDRAEIRAVQASGGLWRCLTAPTGPYEHVRGCNDLTRCHASPHPRHHPIDDLRHPRHEVFDPVLVQEEDPDIRLVVPHAVGMRFPRDQRAPRTT